MDVTRLCPGEVLCEAVLSAVVLRRLLPLGRGGEVRATIGPDAAPPPPAQGLRFFHPTAERALVPRLIPQDEANSSQLTAFINAIAAGDGAAITPEVVTELLRTWSFAVVCEAFREGIHRWHEPYAAVLARHGDPLPAPDPTARAGAPR